MRKHLLVTWGMAVPLGLYGKHPHCHLPYILNVSKNISMNIILYVHSIYLKMHAFSTHAPLYGDDFEISQSRNVVSLCEFGVANEGRGYPSYSALLISIRTYQSIKYQ